MLYRKFGRTGMSVSEVGFGAWGIGGAYGKIDRKVALDALAKAEELGCNFVDTASVYGDSELVLGEFLPARRDRWLVATKFSGQDAGLIATAENQLQRMKVDTIDFYQIHWAPRDDQKQLYDDLYRLKKSGKARFVGVSLGKVEDIDYVLDNTEIDGFQVPCSLLDPLPLLVRLDKIREHGVGIVVRSTLFGGFLTGKFTPDTAFTDATDRRSKWPKENVLKTLASVERFRFLESEGPQAPERSQTSSEAPKVPQTRRVRSETTQEVGSLTVGAARYPLSFPETSTVILGTKTPAQAEVNFGRVPGAVLSKKVLTKIRAVQEALGLWPKGTNT